MSRTIVFCSSRRECIVTAIDMATTLSYKEQSTPQEVDLGDKFLNLTAERGVAFLYPEMAEELQRQVLARYERGEVGMLVLTEGMASRVQAKGRLVVVCDSQRATQDNSHYSLNEVFEMQSFGGEDCEFVLCCQQARAPFYQKFLGEGLPVESQLQNGLAEHINAEVVARTIQSKQDCVDWLSWTFMYRRLLENPNFYNLQKVSHTGQAEYLSDLTEDAVELLDRAGCLSVQEDTLLAPLNMGIIAAYYNLKITTLLTFVSGLTQATSLSQMITLLLKADEFSSIYLPPEEERLLAEIIAETGEKHQSVPASLLQAHLARIALPASLQPALRPLLECCPRLLQALADIVSSQNQLKQLLLSIQISQMVVQGQRLSDSKLLQLQLEGAEIARLEGLGIRDVYEFVGA
jgi:pre-mRNA-splicing helicase BRR2